jgi:DEAD/DEAH box helicase domain-containing protein
LSDQLENGAGYAPRLADVELERGLELAAGAVAAKWQSRSDHPDCDTSCPDCLRSYDNRRLHHHLDWRLALDMVELARGGTLTTDRWHERSRVVAKGLAGPFELEMIELAGVPAVHDPDSGRSVLLGHPLWSAREGELAGEQGAAVREAPGACHLLDPITADRAPDYVARHISQG